MADTLLFVDDDQALLSSIQRALHKQFQIDTVSSPEEGLQRLAENDYAVVVSDFRMPGMNGIEFLSEARKRRAACTRILLTGNADLQTAIRAVNESHIFRLLTKPISREAIATALQAAIDQHRLVIAEQELLSKTLTGSVKILMDLLNSVSPASVERASRLKMLVRGMASRLHVPNAWQFELAAMVSQIGYLTAPTDLRDKFYQGEDLSPEEVSLLAKHGENGRDLLYNVPRLQPVAEILGMQSWVFTIQSFAAEPRHRDVVTLGAQLLQTAAEYEIQRSRKQTREQAIQGMRFSGRYDVMLLHALAQEVAGEGSKVGQTSPSFP